jgi:hypothetical protein
MRVWPIGERLSRTISRRNQPTQTAAQINNTMVAAIGQAQATAASIGSASVAAVDAVTNAHKTYESPSAANDQAYLDDVAVAEKAYLTVVANKWHEFRTEAPTDSFTVGQALRIWKYF